MMDAFSVCEISPVDTNSSIQTQSCVHFQGFAAYGRLRHVAAVVLASFDKRLEGDELVALLKHLACDDLADGWVTVRYGRRRVWWLAVTVILRNIPVVRHVGTGGVNRPVWQATIVLAGVITGS